MVLFKRSWLNLVLDIDFMTLNILKLDFLIIFLEFIIKFKVPLQKILEKHQLNVVLSLV